MPRDNAQASAKDSQLSRKLWSAEIRETNSGVSCVLK